MEAWNLIPKAKAPRSMFAVVVVHGSLASRDEEARGEVELRKGVVRRMLRDWTARCALEETRKGRNVYEGEA